MTQSIFRACLLGLALALAPGLALANIDREPPRISQLLLDKSSRTLHLLDGRRAVRSYKVDLGPNPSGHKRFQGDGRTPEGLYYVTHRNPQSSFFLSLGISYPNEQDRAYARARGLSPGGDIFIHGRGANVQNPPSDWTRGCIALSDKEMAEIFNLVKPGTPIYIKP